jgi:signal transduction histidine kinase/ligand-binding sensor domain-containing protein
MRRLHQILLIVALLGFFEPCEPVYAVPMTPQYSITSWGHKDGLPSTFIYAIAQTNDGFLWLGTADGLVRFDGVQFVSWRSIQPNAAPLGQVRALCASSHGGGLLFGTTEGTLGRKRDDRLQTASLHSAVESIEEAHDGSLWVAGLKTLWHLDGTSLTPIQPPMPLSDNWLSGPLEGDDGTQWITTRQGLFHVDAQSRLTRVDGHLSWSFRLQDGKLGLVDASGRVSSLQNQKTIWQGGKPLPKPSTISGVTADNEGNLWIASQGSGVVRVAGGDGQTSAVRFTRNEGLSSDFARFVFEDGEHDLWFATESGLDRLRRNNVLSLTRREGLLSDTVSSIAAGMDGAIWLGTSEGLERMAGGEHTVYLQGTRILSLLTSSGQKLWAGTSRGLAQWTAGHMSLLPEDAKFVAINALAEDTRDTLWFNDAVGGLFRQQAGHPPEKITSPFLAHEVVTAMWGDHEGEIWFGLRNGNIIAYRKGEFYSYSAQNGLSGGEIQSFSEGADGELLAATERGLCFMTGEHFDCRNFQNGLPGDRVLWAIPDTEGNLWLGYNMGVTKLDLQKLRGPMASSTQDHYWRFYDARDGIENSPALKGNSPAALAQDKRLWMTTSRGIGIIDMTHLYRNAIPPPVHILELNADGQEIDLTKHIQLRPLTRSIQFSFTGLSLSDPQNVHFRYRLDGFDREWHDGGSMRFVSYTNLPPKRYVFRVDAANSDGVWNNTGATLVFDLAPAYFQTLWFLLLCIGIALTFALLLFRARLQSAKRNMRMRFEERIEERARIAQELHDHLIQEMVGIGMQLETAEELTPANARAKRPLERALALSRSAIASGRLTLQELRIRPMTGTVLVEVLKGTAEAYVQKDAPMVQYVVEGDERQLCPEVAEEVSEIGQEALRNALKHAGKSAIVVRLHFGTTSFDLSVRDEGSGIADAVMRTGVTGHYGLAGMRERAARISATISILSAPGRGTTVQVLVPATMAYRNNWEADVGNRNRWSLWKPSRRVRQEKMK